jgi:hypothetical protein
MKVFISWSGEPSRSVAVALRDWLQSVIQSIEPYVSTEDIEKGASWFPEIAQQLNDTNFGIICLTKANAGSRWLNFEAGALFKSVGNVVSRVSPFLIDLRASELEGPLAHLQATESNRDDVAKLLKSIDAHSGQSIGPDRVDRAVTRWWSDLEQQLEAARELAASQPRPEPRATDSMIEEVLELTRGIERRIHRPIASTAHVEGPGEVNIRTAEQEGYRTKNIIHNIWEILNAAGIQHRIVGIFGEIVNVEADNPISLEVENSLRAFAERRGLNITIITKPTD